MQTRQYYLDTVRAGLMLLGIPFHTALIYGIAAEWSVASPDKSRALSLLAVFIHGFRMQAFFLVAGYFSLLLVAKRGPSDWLKSRFVRLGIPLLAGAILLNPIQMFTSVLASNAPGGHRTWAEYAAAFAQQVATPGAHWKRHLWFLIDLLILSVGFVAAWRVRSGPRVGLGLRALDARIRVSPVASYASALVILGVFSVAIATFRKLLGPLHVLWGILDLWSPLVHAPYFIIGLILAREQELLHRFTRLSLTGGLLAALVSVVYLLTAMSTAPHWRVVKMFLWPSVGLLTTQQILAASRVWMNRPSRLVKEMVDASFTIYLVHQPVLGVLGFACLFVSWLPVVEFSLIVVLTLGISFALHRLMSKSALLKFLFNGVAAGMTLRPLVLQAAKENATTEAR